MKNRYVIILLFWGMAIYADTIYLHNETNASLYAAPYYTYTSEAIAVSQPKSVAPKVATAFERPKMKWDLGGRELAVSHAQHLLKSHMTGDEFKLLCKQNIANPLFDNFYVALVNGKLSAFNAINWHVIKPVLMHTKKNIAIFLTATVHRLRILWQRPPYNTQEAQVRLKSDTLCVEEQGYIKARRLKIRTALRKAGFTIAAGQEPIIALCGSGGGVRSAVAFNGTKNGLAKIGFLDMIMYESTLSGSTWEAAPSTHFNNTPAQYKEFLKSRLPGGLINKRFSTLDIGSMFFKKIVFDKPLSMVDVYGGALTSLFLDTPKDKKPYEISLASQAENIQYGSRPMPIYSAITSYRPYVWIYFTPYEVGSNAFGGFIPPWAFGRQFNNKVSINYAPDEPLGYLLGTFGYAIGVNLKEILIHKAKDVSSDFMRSFLRTISEDTLIGNLRLFPAEVNNFTFGMLDAPYGRQKTIKLLDAGIHYNLPIPPLFEKHRAIDVILVCDNSAGSVGEELRKTEEYFKEKKLPFPAIDYSKVSNKVTIFKDLEHPETPVIIYLPLVKKDKYSKTFDPRSCPDDACNTFNFSYTSGLVDLLTGLTEFTIVENKELILSTIKEATSRKAQNNKTPKNKKFNDIIRAT